MGFFDVYSRVESPNGVLGVAVRQKCLIRFAVDRPISICLYDGRGPNAFRVLSPTQCSIKKIGLEAFAIRTRGDRRKVDAALSFDGVQITPADTNSLSLWHRTVDEVFERWAVEQRFACARQKRAAALARPRSAGPTLSAPQGPARPCSLHAALQEEVAGAGHSRPMWPAMPLMIAERNNLLPKRRLSCPGLYVALDHATPMAAAGTGGAEEQGDPFIEAWAKAVTKNARQGLSRRDYKKKLREMGGESSLSALIAKETAGKRAPPVVMPVPASASGSGAGAGGRKYADSSNSRRSADATFLTGSTVSTEHAGTSQVRTVVSGRSGGSSQQGGGGGATAVSHISATSAMVASEVEAAVFALQQLEKVKAKGYKEYVPISLGHGKARTAASAVSSGEHPSHSAAPGPAGHLSAPQQESGSMPAPVLSITRLEAPPAPPLPVEPPPPMPPEDAPAPLPSYTAHMVDPTGTTWTITATPAGTGGGGNTPTHGQQAAWVDGYVPQQQPVYVPIASQREWASVPAQAQGHMGMGTGAAQWLGEQAPYYTPAQAMPQHNHLPYGSPEPTISVEIPLRMLQPAVPLSPTGNTMAGAAGMPGARYAAVAVPHQTAMGMQYAVQHAHSGWQTRTSGESMYGQTYSMQPGQSIQISPAYQPSQIAGMPVQLPYGSSVGLAGMNARGTPNLHGAQYNQPVQSLPRAVPVQVQLPDGSTAWLIKFAEYD